MKVSATSTGLKFTLSNGFTVSMLDHEHPDGTREFAVLRPDGDLMRLEGDTIAFATKEQILAMIRAIEETPDWSFPQAVRGLVRFMEVLKED